MNSVEVDEEAKVTVQAQDWDSGDSSDSSKNELMTQEAEVDFVVFDYDESDVDDVDDGPRGRTTGRQETPSSTDHHQSLSNALIVAVSLAWSLRKLTLCNVVSSTYRKRSQKRNCHNQWRNNYSGTRWDLNR